MALSRQMIKMCDPGSYGYGYQPAWNSDFYHQYLQFHNKMTQWMQQFHQHIPIYASQNFSNDHNCHCCSHDKKCTPQAPNSLFAFKQPTSGCTGNGQYMPQCTCSRSEQPMPECARSGQSIPQCTCSRGEQPMPGYARSGQPIPQCTCSESEQPIQGRTRSTQLPIPGYSSKHFSNNYYEPIMPRKDPKKQRSRYVLPRPPPSAQFYEPNLNPSAEDQLKEEEYCQMFPNNSTSMNRNDVTYGPGSDYHYDKKPRSSRTYPRHTERAVYEDPTGGIDDEEEESSDDDSSGDEVVFNVDAILSMRAAKSQSDKEEEDSFELIDSMVDENFEYVELDAYGKSQRRFGRPPEPNAQRDLENERELRRLLYGEMGNTMGGLETAMSVTYDHLCDLHQHQLWPVLPINL